MLAPQLRQRQADYTEIECWLIGHAHELAAHGAIQPGIGRRDYHERSRCFTGRRCANQGEPPPIASRNA